MGNVRIAVPNCAITPLVFPCVLKSGSLKPNASVCLCPGTDAEILGEILHQIKLKATFVPSGCDYSLTLDMISNGSADTGVFGYSITSQRLHRFDFSYPYRFMGRGYLTQKMDVPPEGNVFRSLNPETWFSVFSILAVSMLLLLFRHKKFGNSNTDVFWPVISLMTLHYNGSESQLKSSRALLLGTLGVMALFVFNLYQSVLLQIMTSKRVVVPFKNTMELARLIASGEKYLLVVHGSSSSYIYQVQHSLMPAFQSMKAALNQNPLVIEPNDTLLGYRLSLDPMAATPAFTDEAMNQLAVHCNLIYQIDSALPSRSFSFLFRKNHPVLANFSVKIIENQDFIRHTVTKYRKRAVELQVKKCASLKPKDPQPGDPLNIFSFQSVFYLVLCGLFAGIYCFLSEMAWHKWKALKQEALVEVGPTLPEISMAPPLDLQYI